MTSHSTGVTTWMCFAACLALEGALPCRGAEIRIFSFSDLTNACSYNTASMPTNHPLAKVYTFTAGDSAQAWLGSILKKTGVSEDKFELRTSVSVSNAMATEIAGKRYIFYNDDWLTKFLEKTPDTNWAALGLFCHEIGHHINGHTFTKSKSIDEKHRDELEADRWAGFWLRNFEGTEQQALVAVQTFANEQPTEDHPPKIVRESAVKDGWRSADRQKRAEAVTASFVSDVTSGMAPLEVRFESASLGAIKTHEWTFGDGKSSTDVNPVHEYKKPGTYTVSLKVKGIGQGQDSQVKDSYIQVLSPFKADFECIPREGPSPLAVEFKAIPQGAGFSYAWEFGDGSTSSDPNPSNTYKRPGNYTVKLTIKAGDTAATESKLNYVVVKDKASTADESPEARPEAKDVRIVESRNPVAHRSLGTGVRVIVDGQLEHIKGKRVRLVARFSFLNVFGDRVPLVAHPQETRFRDTAGCVATHSLSWRATKDSLDLSEVARSGNHPLDLFMPFYPLNLAPGTGVYTIYTSLEILVDGESIYSTPDDEASVWTAWRSF